MYHTINQATFVCFSVCSLSPPRSFDGSSPNLVGVCRWTSELPLRGSFSKRSTGQRVTFIFTVLYMIADDATPLQKTHSVVCSLDGSTGQTSLFRSRRHQAETTPLQKVCPAKGIRRLRVQFPGRVYLLVLSMLPYNLSSWLQMTLLQKIQRERLSLNLILTSCTVELSRNTIDIFGSSTT